MSEEQGLFGKLFNQLPTEYAYESKEKYQAQLFEQYKLYVEMADRINSRRQSANSYFLSINTALLGFIGYVSTKDAGTLFWLVAAAGIALSYLWYRLIRSYRDLNTAKFKVVHEIEKRLPLSLYDAEWEAMGRGNKPELYKPFTHIETGVPWVFLVLHALVLLQSFPWKALRNWLYSCPTYDAAALG